VISLDLNDLNIESLDIGDSNDEFADGHGLTEIGASTNQNNSCGQGSCSTNSGGGVDPGVIFNQ
jgi:hypothetical protein